MTEAGAPAELRRERFGAMGGVLFVVLDGAIGLLGGEPPPGAAAASEVASYVSEHETPLQAGLWVFGLASMALIWWFGSVWRRMVRAEGGAPRLAVVSLVGLVLAGALSLTASAVWAAMALRVEELGASAPVLYTLGAVLLAASGFGVATHLVATSVVGARTGTMAPWLVGCGFVSAFAFTASGVLGATSTSDTVNVVGLVAFVLWMAWILGVSHRLWSDGGAIVAAGSA